MKLPNDNEVRQWFIDNIGVNNNCSASSAIYKFRMWLKDLNELSGEEIKPFESITTAGDLLDEELQRCRREQAETLRIQKNCYRTPGI